MDWINLIKKDGNDALKKIYTLYRNECVQWQVNTYQVSEELAKDAFQMSIVILYQNVINEKISSLSSGIKTYLFGIVKNKLSELRKKESRYHTDGKIGILKSEFSNDIENKENFEILITNVSKALTSMGDPCKSILQLFYYDKLKMKEISLIVGHDNASTTKTKKYKCLKRLGKLVQNPHVV